MILPPNGLVLSVVSELVASGECNDGTVVGVLVVQAKAVPRVFSVNPTSESVDSSKLQVPFSTWYLRPFGLRYD